MFFVIFFLFITVLESHGSVAETVLSPLISMTSSILSPSKEFCLEQIMLVTKADMNDGGAIKVHIVIVYDKELFRELSRMSANKYFQAVKQLQKDFPDKFEVIGKELVAKDRMIPWESLKFKYLKGDMTSVGGLIFASYNNSGEHRAVIPNYVKLKIIFEQKDFRIEYEDKDSDEDDDDS